MNEQAGVKNSIGTKPSRITIRKKNGAGRLMLLLIMAGAVWFAVYLQLQPFSPWLIFEFFGLERGTQLGDALQFFAYDTPKVLMLLALVVFLSVWWPAVSCLSVFYSTC